MISCLSQKLGLGLITLIIHILPMMSQPDALSALCAHPHLSNSTPSFSLLHDLASSLSHWFPQGSSCLHFIGCPYHLPFPCPMPLTPILMPPTSIPILSCILSPSPSPYFSSLCSPLPSPCTSYPIIDTVTIGLPCMI